MTNTYARLAQEVGRLPASNHLQHKALADPNFPSRSAFSRLGPKAELVRKLLEYCRTRGGMEDVVRMCEEYRPRPSAESPQIGSEKVRDGFVYLMKSGRYYKIGKSNAPGRREYEFSIQLPEQSTKMHEIRTDDPTGIEAYWHRRFEAKRKSGEWFELNAQDVTAFKRRKFM